MFGKNRHSDPMPGSPEVGLLGVGTRFRGNIRFRGTLRIDGSVDGAVRAEPGSGSVLVINQNANVLGSVVADSVLISGTVAGDVIAHGRVEVYRKGSVTGDIYTGEIMIEGGALFRGTCRMIDDLNPDEQRQLLARAGGLTSTPPVGGAPPQEAAEKHYTA